MYAEDFTLSVFYLLEEIFPMSWQYSATRRADWHIDFCLGLRLPIMRIYVYGLFDRDTAQLVLSEIW